MFKRDVHHYHVVELPANTKLPELTGDLREGLKALALMPAFQYLMLRLRLKKAAMQQALDEGFKLELDALRYFQAGIYWAGDIERDMKILTQDQTQPRPASTDEQGEFKRMLAALNLIGNEATPQG